MTTTPIQSQCVRCGASGPYVLQPVENPITRKRRHKFGLLWVLFTLLTCGFGFLLWLVWPRYNEKVGVDRFVVCSQCHARQ